MSMPPGGGRCATAGWCQSGADDFAAPVAETCPHPTVFRPERLPAAPDLGVGADVALAEPDPGEPELDQHRRELIVRRVGPAVTVGPVDEVAAGAVGRQQRSVLIRSAGMQDPDILLHR